MFRYYSDSDTVSVELCMYCLGWVRERPRERPWSTGCLDTTVILIQYRALCVVWDGCCPDITAMVDWVLNTKLLEMGERETERP